MKYLLVLPAFIYIFLISFDKENKTTYNEVFKTENLNQEPTEKIVLGEDLNEINAFVKNIYSKNGKTYVEIDVVQIKYRNTDERVIINKNPKIRTYLIDQNTLTYTDDCKEASLADLMKIKDRILKNKTLLIVGQSKNGKMTSINFGCYG